MNFRNSFGHVWDAYVVVAGAVLLVVVALIAFAVVRYRASRVEEPSHRAEYKRGEPLYALGLAVIAAGLAVFAAQANAAERQPLDPPALSVAITGFQWCWSFHYDHTPVTVTSTCAGSIPTLVVPTGKNIHFSLTSADVIHEWWLPAMRWKEEAFPDHENTFDMRFDTTGHWEGRCDEFCGLYHDRMEFYVRAVPPKAFAAWLASEEKNAATAATAASAAKAAKSPPGSA